jgi:hypothetical protein
MKQQRIDTPMKQQRIDTPIKQQRVDTLMKQQRVDTPMKQQRIDTPMKQQRVDTPMKQQRIDTMKQLDDNEGWACGANLNTVITLMFLIFPNSNTHIISLITKMSLVTFIMLIILIPNNHDKT